MAPRSNIRRPPYFATLLATATVLTLVGLYTLVMLQGQRLLQDLRESITVVAELRPSVTPTELTELDGYLKAAAFAKTGSVRYISSAEGAEQLREAYGEEFLRFDEDNPLFDLYTFNVGAGYTADEELRLLQRQLEEHTAVLDVYVQDDVLAQLAGRVERYAWAGVAIGLLLLIGVLFMVVNTARLALLSRAVVIRNMELVGAGWGFISRPFLQRACVVGAIGGAVAVAFTALVAQGAEACLPDLWRPLSAVHLTILLIALVLTGILLNFTATFVVVRRTLRLRIDDLG